MFTLLAMQSFGVEGSTWGGCIGPMFRRVWGILPRMEVILKSGSLMVGNQSAEDNRSL